MAEINWGLLSPTPQEDTLTVINNARENNVKQQVADTARTKVAADIATAQRQQALYGSAGDKFDAGNTQGSTADLLRAGSADLVNAGTGASKEAFSQHTAGLQAIGGFANYVMQNIQDPEQRKAVLAHNKPLLVGAGAHPEDVDAVIANPSNDVLGGIAHQYYAPKDQDANVIADRTATTNSQNAATQATNAETSRMAENRLQQTPVGIDPKNDVYVPGAVGGAGGTGGSAIPSGVGGHSDSTVAARNNNPGAMRWDGKSKWQGMTGVDPNGFITFDTPANGMRALGINIKNQAVLHNINNLGDYVHKYAPQADNNNEAGYAGTLAKALGVGVHDKIDFTDPKVISVLQAAHTAVESGGTPSKFNGVSGGPGGTSVGPQLIHKGVATSDIDPEDPAIKLASRQYAATGEMPPLGNGNGPMRKIILQQAGLIAQANHYTPAQIQANRAQMKASQSALASDNKMFDTIQTAEATALANGQRYIDLAQNMPGNTRSSTWNSIRNGVGAEFSDHRVLDANAAYTTFIGEYNRVVNSTPSGAGTMSDSSRHEAIESFSNAPSPAAKASAFEVLKQDMAARKKAQQDIIDRRSNLIANIGNHDPAPTAVQATKSLGGKTYYKINGHWYDNQAGK